ncbi:MAG: hypothetical protein C0507_20785 [Cyanobacteria bacterium PR.3.49]|nr:hypothetical protein [Cyanobacteria bacterium PR.3.49]
MNRREFLKTAGLTAASLLMPNVQVWAKTAATGTTQNAAATNKLVVVFLRGAIDGLSVVVPYADSRYYKVRNNIAIPPPGSELGALDLNGEFGLHPALSALMPLWKNGSLSFILNTGSPDPTRSHFDAQDYMESGCPGRKSTSTGWLNRLLAQLPDNHSPVRALNIGTTTPRILQGPVASATFKAELRRRRTAIDNEVIASSFERMYEGRGDSLERAFLDGMEARSTINDKLSGEMMQANGGAIAANRFGAFGRQLGKLMSEEPKVQVAFVDLGGFDTHVNQGNGKGQLANHLQVLGKGLSDLASSLGDTYDRTAILVMSEFGRTVKENGNNGTDHGHGNFIWALGGAVKGGQLLGRWDGLSDNSLYENRDLPVRTDFRSVISSVAGDHLQLSTRQLQTVFPDFAPEKVSGLLKA